MTKEILIRSGPGEKRISFTASRKLRRVLIDREGDISLINQIHVARVSKIDKELDAAFLDGGGNEKFFLDASDAQILDSRREQPQRINKLFTEGEMVLVQVKQDSKLGKSARVSIDLEIGDANLSLSPKRSGVCMLNNSDGLKKTSGIESILEVLGSKGVGFKIKCRALSLSPQTVLAEAEKLLETWEQIKSRVRGLKNPTLLYQPAPEFIRFLYEVSDRNIKQILVDDHRCYQEIEKVLCSNSSEFLELLKLYDGEEGIYETYDLETQWEELLSNRVSLPSGGSLIIEETSAMTTIDVNTSQTNFTESNKSKRNFKVNLEAVCEVANQMVLRNLGGQIIIDLLPQRDRKSRNSLIDAFRKAISFDPIYVNLIGFTRLGLFELTRQRVGVPLAQQLLNRYENIQSPSTVAFEALYRVQREIVKSSNTYWLIEAAPNVAEILISGVANPAKVSLEKRTFSKIEVLGDADYSFSEFSVRSTSRAV
ncbi:MAG: ribonuclease E/G [Pseudomonadota bacterium]|nr:ribonuclease E/G [Pseudomonadota bacterium]